MSAGRDERDVRRPHISVRNLLLALWGYAVAAGVLATIAGTVLAQWAGDGPSPVALRLAIALVLAVAAGWWSPVVIRFLRQLIVRR
jgi:hypothetical protein